jgi:hypothetical protein
MTKKKLDLLQVAARFTAKLRAGAAKIMRTKPLDANLLPPRYAMRSVPNFSFTERILKSRPRSLAEMESALTQSLGAVITKSQRQRSSKFPT